MIEVLLSWLARLLILVLIIRVVLPALFGRRRPTARRTPPSVERSGGQLVRDPQCGTYVPIDRAVRVGDGPGAQYFCSTACRDAHASAKSSVAS